MLYANKLRNLIYIYDSGSFSLISSSLIRLEFHSYISETSTITNHLIKTTGNYTKQSIISNEITMLNSDFPAM